MISSYLKGLWIETGEGINKEVCKMIALSVPVLTRLMTIISGSCNPDIFASRRGFRQLWLRGEPAFFFTRHGGAESFITVSLPRPEWASWTDIL